MTEPKPVRTASVALVLLVIFLDTLGIGVIIPVLPRLVASFVGGDLAAGSRWYGVLSATYSSMQFMFAPAIGALSDRFGRRTVILGSLAGAATNYVLTIFAPSLAWLFVGRVIAGVSGASFSAATAYIADVTPPRSAPRTSASSAPCSGSGSSWDQPSAGSSGASICAPRSRSRRS